MATRVLLTIDTELASRHHAAGLDWRENYARSIEPAGVGLSYQLARLSEHRLKACFFIDPMPALVFGSEPVRRMVATVLDAGQEVQLHCHPNWLGAAADGTVAPGTPYELTLMDRERQQAAIVKARELLIEAGAPEPVAFRAGSYAANDDTLAILAELGIAFDSSFNGAEPPDVRAISLPPEQAAPVETGGVCEVPVAQLVQPHGTLRPLQICAVSSGELRLAIDHAAARNHPATVIVGHSFELATRGGERVNDVVRGRFDRLCRDLAERRDRAPSVHFADLDPADLAGAAAHAAVPPLRYARRMAEQLWANWIERRAA